MRQVGLSGILLECLPWDNNEVNYDVVWNLREEKIKNCVIFVWQPQKDDAENQYTLIVQHIGNSGPRSNNTAKHNNSKNGRR